MSIFHTADFFQIICKFSLLMAGQVCFLRLSEIMVHTHIIFFFDFIVTTITLTHPVANDFEMSLNTDA